jgi:hypothetical protein
LCIKVDKLKLAEKMSRDDSTNVVTAYVHGAKFNFDRSFVRKLAIKYANFNPSKCDVAIQGCAPQKCYMAGLARTGMNLDSTYLVNGTN